MGHQLATRLNCHQIDFSLSMPSLRSYASRIDRFISPIRAGEPIRCIHFSVRHRLSPGSSDSATATADRTGNLGWVLDNAKRLPPLMVLPSVFVRQSQTRRLTRFVRPRRGGRAGDA